jgi:hypothetical protein
MCWTKNAWSYISTSPYVFVKRCLVKQQGLHLKLTILWNNGNRLSMEMGPAAEQISTMGHWLEYVYKRSVPSHTCSVWGRRLPFRDGHGKRYVWSEVSVVKSVVVSAIKIGNFYFSNLLLSIWNELQEVRTLINDDSLSHKKGRAI